MHVCSVVSYSLQPYRLWPARLLCPGILRARILKGVVPSSSRRCSRHRDWTQVSCVSCIAGGFFIAWAIQEAQFSHIHRKKRGVGGGLASLQALLTKAESGGDFYPWSGCSESQPLCWSGVRECRDLNFHLRRKRMSLHPNPPVSVETSGWAWTLPLSCRAKHSFSSSWGVVRGGPLDGPAEQNHVPPRRL